MFRDDDSADCSNVSSQSRTYVAQEVAAEQTGEQEIME